MTTTPAPEEPVAPTIALKDWDWDREGYVVTDYPAAPAIEFIDWLRTTKAWHNDPEMVHRRVKQLNERFSAHRQTLAEARAVARAAAVAPVAPAVMAAPKPKRSHRKKSAPAKEVANA